MSGIVWHQAVEIITPYIVRITTPQYLGTGFQITYASNNDICAIATAAHVIEHADDWQEPIRIQHMGSEESLLVLESDRAIILDLERDTAVILMNRNNLPMPASSPQMIEQGQYLKVGNDIGWLGFPAVSQSDMCFFGGRVSAWRESDNAYLVDGVAINGVSGGPAFFINDEVPEIIGVVSAYVPNRESGEALPGLAVVQGVEQFHELAPTFKSLEQAKRDGESIE